MKMNKNPNTTKSEKKNCIIDKIHQTFVSFTTYILVFHHNIYKELPSHVHQLKPFE